MNTTVQMNLAGVRPAAAMETPCGAPAKSLTSCSASVRTAFRASVRASVRLIRRTLPAAGRFLFSAWGTAAALSVIGPVMMWHTAAAPDTETANMHVAADGLALIPWLAVWCFRSLRDSGAEAESASDYWEEGGEI